MIIKIRDRFGGSDHNITIFTLSIQTSVPRELDKNQKRKNLKHKQTGKYKILFLKCVNWDFSIRYIMLIPLGMALKTAVLEAADIAIPSEK